MLNVSPAVLSIVLSSGTKVDNWNNGAQILIIVGRSTALFCKICLALIS